MRGCHALSEAAALEVIPSWHLLTAEAFLTRFSFQALLHVSVQPLSGLLPLPLHSARSRGAGFFLSLPLPPPCLYHSFISSSVPVSFLISFLFPPSQPPTSAITTVSWLWAERCEKRDRRVQNLQQWLLTLQETLN